jgi:predicted TIM-barrel fold metal-dependent hydrolase
MRLPIIDADGHVMEPFELWEERLPEEYKDWGWKRTKSAAGEEVSFLGRVSGFEWTVGSLCTPGALSAGGRLDRDLDTEVDAGAHDPVRRIELMDEQGVAVSVLFPTMTLGLDDIPDPGFRSADARAYNSWIADFCTHDPVRLRYAAVIPLAELDWALAEIDRAVADGATTVMVSPIPTPDGRDLGSPELDPVWSRLVDAGLPAVVHASNPASPALGMVHLWRNRGQWQMGVPFQLQLAVMHVIDGGVLDRHPELRIGFFEGDVGWLPHWLGRLDETYAKMALVTSPPPRGAVDQFRAQCVISGEPADLGFAAAVDLVGADHVLWASDWPHQDGAWPDPILLLRDRVDLTDAQKRACFVDGPARFYGIDLDGLLAHLGPGWSLDADLDTIGGMLPSTTPSV